MTVFNDTFDTVSPGGGDDPSEADDRMRETKAAVQERMNVDGYWPLTGTEVSDTDAGEQRKLTIRTLTVDEVAALSATKAYIYRLVTDGELYFKDASDNTIQITSGGKILSASLDMKDEDDMTSDSAVHAATQQSIKAFAEAVAAVKEDILVTQATASIFGAWTNLDSLGGALAKTEVYKVGSDGFLIAQDAEPTSGSTTVFYVYTDGSNPPTTARGVYKDTDGGTMNTLTIPIRKGDYWKVTWQSAVILYWLPIGTGTCVKQ